MSTDADHHEQLRDAANQLARVIAECRASGMTLDEISQALGLPTGEVERLQALDVREQT